MKKFLFIGALSLIMGASTIYGTTYDKQLEEVIFQTKSVIEIPEAFSKFDYRIEEKEERLKVYYLTWSDPKSELSPISVSIEEGGRMISYRHYAYTEEQEKLAQISYEEGMKVAQDFLNQVTKNYDNSFVLEDERQYEGDVYLYRFEEYVGEIPVLHSQVDITVNKQTGKVETFKGIPTYLGDYKTPSQWIDEQKAYELYLEAIPFELNYNIYTDYKQKSVEAFPVYVAENREYIGIEAETGKVCTPYWEEEENFYRKGMEESAKKDEELTKEEQLAKEVLGTLLSKEQAIEKAAQVFQVDKNQTYEGNLYHNQYTQRYIWALRSEKVNLAVDAQTGDILSYYYIQDQDSSNQQVQISYEEGLKTAEVLLRKICSKEWQTTTLSSQDKENEDKRYTYQFVRQVNGIAVPEHSLTVSVDAINGGIVYYNQDWNHHVTFRDITDDFTSSHQTKIDKQVMEMLNFKLYYVNTSEQERRPIYTVEQNYGIFNPLTGDKISSYDGTIIKEEKVPQYKDIAGHWAEKIIKKLVDSGIYLPEENFRPDEGVTQSDFLRLLLGYSEPPHTEESIYQTAIKRDILEQAEKNPEKIITVAEGIRYIIHYLGYQEVAVLEDVFINPVEETDVILPEEVGYMALARGLKIININQFKPFELLTRAQACELIYNMLD